MTTLEDVDGMDGTPVFDYKTLKRINQSSRKAKRNRNVYFEKLPIKNDGTLYPVTFVMLHSDRGANDRGGGEIRTRILLNGETGDLIFLDMSIEEYEALPRVKGNAPQDTKYMPTDAGVWLEPEEWAALDDGVRHE